METFDNEQRQRERIRKRVRSIAGFYKHLTAYIVVNAILILIKYFRHENEVFLSFQTFSTAIFWGIGLTFHALSVFGPSAMLGRDWEERKIREIMERNKQTKWE